MFIVLAWIAHILSAIWIVIFSIALIWAFGDKNSKWGGWKKEAYEARLVYILPWAIFLLSGWYIFW